MTCSSRVNSIITVEILLVYLKQCNIAKFSKNVMFSDMLIYTYNIYNNVYSTLIFFGNPFLYYYMKTLVLNYTFHIIFFKLAGSLKATTFFDLPISYFSDRNKTRTIMLYS